MLYLVHLPYVEAKKQNVDLFKFVSDDKILSEYDKRLSLLMTNTVKQ